MQRRFSLLGTKPDVVKVPVALQQFVRCLKPPYLGMFALARLGLARLGTVHLGTVMFTPAHLP